MSGPRKVAKTKRTASGKILGRPVRGSKAAPSAPATLPAPKPVRWKRYLKSLRSPDPVVCPITGEEVRPFGPPKPVFEWRVVKRGRPPVRDIVTITRIVTVHQSTGQRGFAQRVAAGQPHRTISAVKREQGRARRDMKHREKDAVTS